MAPALTEEETKEMMEKILTKLKMIASKMMPHIESIKQQYQAAGQDMDDKTICKMILLPHITRDFQKAQDDVLEEYDVDADELEEANSEYMKNGHKKLIEITNTIKKIYNEFGGEVDGLEEEEQDSPIQVAPGASTEDIAVQLLTLLAQKMAEQTERYIITFKEKHGVPKTNKDKEMFQQGMLVISEG